MDKTPPKFPTLCARNGPSLMFFPTPLVGFEICDLPLLCSWALTTLRPTLRAVKLIWRIRRVNVAYTVGYRLYVLHVMTACRLCRYVVNYIQHAALIFQLAYSLRTTQHFTYLLTDSVCHVHIGVFTFCLMTPQNTAFLGVGTGNSGVWAYDPQIRTRARFLSNAPTHQVSSSCV